MRVQWIRLSLRLNRVLQCSTFTARDVLIFGEISRLIPSLIVGECTNSLWICFCTQDVLSGHVAHPWDRVRQWLRVRASYSTVGKVDLCLTLLKEVANSDLVPYLVFRLKWIRAPFALPIHSVHIFILEWVIGLHPNFWRFREGTFDVFNVKKILFDCDLFCFFRATASNIIMLNSVSDELRGWWRHILETGKLVGGVQRVGWFTSWLELDTVGLWSFDIVIHQIILCFV